MPRVQLIENFLRVQAFVLQNYSLGFFHQGLFRQLIVENFHLMIYKVVLLTQET